MRLKVEECYRGNIMQNKKKVSVCLTVYNQIDIVKENLVHFLSYEGNDVEMIVNDDNSTDDIEGLVKSFNDERVIYHRTQGRLGHDLNIVDALKQASGEYVMILRSRDFVYGEHLGDIVAEISKYPRAAYFVFSSMDERGVQNLNFSNREYEFPYETAKAHMKLFVHPSGSIYKRSFLMPNLYDKYIKTYFDNKYAFTVHELIRVSLVDKGTFVTSSKIVWQYTRSSSAKDTAVNSSTNKRSVYDPIYQYPRYKCIFEFIDNEISGNVKEILLLGLISDFYKRIVVDFKNTNNDTKLQQHYNYDSINFDERKEERRFISFTNDLLSRSSNSLQIKAQKSIHGQRNLRVFWYPIKYRIMNILSNTRIISLLVRIKNRN